MTVSGKPNVVAPVVLNEAEQAFQIAISELGRYADDPSVRNMLRAVIKERGCGDPVAVARAAVDEVVLATGGRVRPLLAN